MTRTITILGLVSFLVVGAAAASILGHDVVPSTRGDRETTAAVAPQSNRESKNDKLPLLMASLPAAQTPQPSDEVLPEPLRQAFAPTEPSPFPAPPQISAPVTIPQQQAALPPQSSSAPPKPKMVMRPPQQKSYALLSDVQIAGIKERLKLSASQEAYWPAVEGALRAVARKIHATRQSNPNGPIIDPSSDEVAQLKSAAMPLLFQLREDQKREVRQLAHVIGLGAVASMI